MILSHSWQNFRYKRIDSSKHTHSYQAKAVDKETKEIVARTPSRRELALRVTEKTMRVYRKLIFIWWRKISRSNLTRRRTSDRSPSFSRNSRPIFGGVSSRVTEKKYTPPTVYEISSLSAIRSSRRLVIRFPGRSRARSTAYAIVITRHDVTMMTHCALWVCVRTLLLADDDSRMSSVLGRMRHVLISAATGR